MIMAVLSFLFLTLVHYILVGIKNNNHFSKAPLVRNFNDAG